MRAIRSEESTSAHSTVVGDNAYHDNLARYNLIKFGSCETRQIDSTVNGSDILVRLKSHHTF